MCFWSFFFFKQKTAYEMRISDWSSDVCSSDLDSPLGERDFPHADGVGCKDVAGDEQRHREDKEEGRGDEIDDGFRSLREALVDHIDPDVRILAKAISDRQQELHAENKDNRAEESRVGKACIRLSRYRCRPIITKKT